MPSFRPPATEAKSQVKLVLLHRMSDQPLDLRVSKYLEPNAKTALAKVIIREFPRKNFTLMNYSISAPGYATVYMERINGFFLPHD